MGQRRPGKHLLNRPPQTLLERQVALQIVLHRQRHGLVKLHLRAQDRTPQPIGLQRRRRWRQRDATARRSHWPTIIVVQVIGVEKGDLGLPARLP
jgi:hypothetical protein